MLWTIIFDDADGLRWFCREGKRCSEYHASLFLHAPYLSSSLSPVCLLPPVGPSRVVTSLRYRFPQRRLLIPQRRLVFP